MSDTTLASGMLVVWVILPALMVSALQVLSQDPRCWLGWIPVALGAVGWCRIFIWKWNWK